MVLIGSLRFSELVNSGAFVHSYESIESLAAAIEKLEQVNRDLAAGLHDAKKELLWALAESGLDEVDLPSGGSYKMVPTSVSECDNEGLQQAIDEMGLLGKFLNPDLTKTKINELRKQKLLTPAQKDQLLSYFGTVQTGFTLKAQAIKKEDLQDEVRAAAEQVIKNKYPQSQQTAEVLDFNPMPLREVNTIHADTIPVF